MAAGMGASQRTENPVNWQELFAASGELIAPTWPLDQMIAVNPFWELRHLPVADVAARLAALGRINMLTPTPLQGATDGASNGLAVPETESSDDGVSSLGHWHNISDLLDERRDLVHRMSWHDEIVEQISRFCARYFAMRDGVSDDPQALYGDWLATLRHDTGIAILMGEPEVARQFELLPESHAELLELAPVEMGLVPEVAEAYGHALLLDIKGWAAWIAYLRWQARLQGGTHTMMNGLLAVRLAWELLLWRYVAVTDSAAARQLAFHWRGQQGALPRMIANHRAHQVEAWRDQYARESAYQSALAADLLAASGRRPDQPALQAVFCIDVRSESFRRHLEAQHPGIQTIGFAGFFGLPIDFTPAGSAVSRPQLPGLLPPSLSARELAASDESLARHRDARWSEVGDAAPAMFGLVEATGLAYAWRLLRQTFFADAHSHNAVGPLELADARGALDVNAKATLAAGVLRAMGLVSDLADTVLLVAHGSCSTNNPHAASLDCGACGGQSGAVNVRILAELLNDNSVRQALRAQGLVIPSRTRFLAALHETTRDEVRCIDGTICSPRVEEWLEAAAEGVRRERPHASPECSDDDLAAAASIRACDWSEVRPEWGLANNAAFIAAPRARTAHLDLEGRAFLHDYTFHNDTDGSLLTLILTAPVVVANWINMQYNASVADNRNYGSGSKTLHNVVLGNLGVLEGQGGDLRTGLSLQSLHDGQHWMHTLQRLSVYVEAPQGAIDEVYRDHAVVRQLVDNEWIFLFQIGGEGISRRDRGGWRKVAASESHQ